MKNVILDNLPVVIAALSFIYGVNAWRRTTVGQKRIEIAVDAVVAFRELEQALREIRSPLSHGGEGSTRKPGIGETDEERKIGEQAFVAIERMNARNEKFTKVESLQNYFEAYYGAEGIKPFETIREIKQNIMQASLTLQFCWKRQGRVKFATEQEKEAHLKKMHDAEAIFWDGFEKDDPIRKQFNTAMDQINVLCTRTINPTHNIKTLTANTLHWFRRFFLCR